MRRIFIALLIFGLFPALAVDAVTGANHAEAASAAISGKVVKVLSFFLDTQGRIAKSPSLFDRDAYQVWLRNHPKEISGMRFDVLWSATKSTDENLKLRVELRGIGPDGLPREKAMETAVKLGIFRRWTQFRLAGDDFKKFGSVTAWRATLWNGDQLLGEQKSFLW